MLDLLLRNDFIQSAGPDELPAFVMFEALTKVPNEVLCWSWPLSYFQNLKLRLHPVMMSDIRKTSGSDVFGKTQAATESSKNPEHRVVFKPWHFSATIVMHMLWLAPRPKKSEPCWIRSGIWVGESRSLWVAGHRTPDSDQAPN